MSSESDYEKEIETYLEKLRKIAKYQRYIITPFLVIMAMLILYQYYNSHTWWDAASVVAFIGCAFYNYRDAKKTFAKIMLHKLTK